MSDYLGREVATSRPNSVESTQFRHSLSNDNKNHSFCVEFAEVFKFMIEKKNLNRKVVKKMAWSALTPAIFQFTYKECKKKSKFGPKKSRKNRKTFFFDIVIQTLGISSQIIFLRKSTQKSHFATFQVQ